MGPNGFRFNKFGSESSTQNYSEILRLYKFIKLIQGEKEPGTKDCALLDNVKILDNADDDNEFVLLPFTPNFPTSVIAERRPWKHKQIQQRTEQRQQMKIQ